MQFVQLIDYETDRPDEMDRLMDQWAQATEGTRIPTSAMVGHDRDNPKHYVEIVEFPSYEEAMRNNDLPETQQFADRMRALCTRGPSFVNLNVERHTPA